jgi:O-antigen/teichoic acid export membrane protein
MTTSRPSRSLLAIVGQLSGLNVLIAAFGFITGPILARALDADGRGELAAIVAPLSVAPLILILGLGGFSAMVVARRMDVGVVVVTAGALAVALGVLFIPLGVIGAKALAGGNDTVETFLTLGAVTMPLTLLGGVVSNIALGLERWHVVTVQRLIPPVGGLVALVVLFVLGSLTVVTAAAATLIFATLALLPPFLCLRGARAWRFDPALAREAILFGGQVWFIPVSQLLNQRVDQMVMFRMTSARELGLYAVAVSISGMPALVAQAAAQAVLPRIAAGQTELLPRTVRLGLLSVALPALGIAAISPFVVPWLFGESFSGAVPMVWILLLASVVSTGSAVLGFPLATILRRPAVAGLGEVLALVVTAVGLVVLLPTLGGIGAAIVSVGAYAINFAWLLSLARRELGGSRREYLVPHAGELVELVRRFTRRDTDVTPA